MNAVIYILITVIVIAILAGITFLQVRKVLRERKNIERGLKMVPLFIHLPPSSEDIEGNGRDTRDVVEETISRAQTIYNIIAGTVKSGVKEKFFYGQRHFAFEIIGSQGFVYFYALVPVSMVEVVKQAIVSSYPSARLDEVGEHNIFNRVGKTPGTLGGEIHLKQSFAYPIATYEDTKRDGMQALLNALSSLSKEDGAAIQILMRPAFEHWREQSKSVAEGKRNGNKKSTGAVAGSWAKSFFMAFAKPVEEKKEEKKKELSNLEQATLDSIDAKTREAGYEVLIRIVHIARAKVNYILDPFFRHHSQ